MPVFVLPRAPVFPDPGLAEDGGLLAVGGDLSPERLVAAYGAGVFPWYSAGEPLLWWSPDPRLVLEPKRLHVSRSLARTLRRGVFEVRVDTAFDRVVERCARARRSEGAGTWITPAMRRAYGRLHGLGLAHSFEAWRDGRLVGGLYGVSLGGCFFGESMFAAERDASKVALARLAQVLDGWGFDLIDCQVRTQHLQSLGATEVPRAEFLARLAASRSRADRRGSWTELVPAS